MTGPAGTPVVFLHALALHSGMWQAHCRYFRERGHPALALDQRGFGAAPLGDVPPSLDVVADDVNRALDERGFGRAVLAGVSMGAYVAMAVLRRHPDRVAGLALISARASADTPDARAQRGKFAHLVQNAETRDLVVEGAAGQLLGKTTRRKRPDLAARVLADARAASPRALAWAQQAIADRPDSRPVLRRAAVPTVVVAGGEDELVSPAESRETADAVPGGELMVVGHAGHLPPLEAPRKVTAAVRRVLGRTGPAA